MGKAMMVIIDGLTDQAIPELGDRACYCYARHPHLDRFSSSGYQGYIDACPKGYIPESMACILNLLGVENTDFPLSRAGLELRSLGYSLAEDEIALRCNLVAISPENRLISFNGGRLNNEEMQMISHQFKEITNCLSFLPMSDYRNLLVLKKENFSSLKVTTYPPHEHLGDDIDFLLQNLSEGSPQIKEFLYMATEFLRKFAKTDENYHFYPWGITGKEQLPSFELMYNHRAAAVCAADIVKGIALAMGMHVPILKDVTADTDTDLRAKAEAACDLQADYDFVLIHINGTDEASHRKDYLEKVRFIERIDQEFIAYLMKNVEKDTRIMICADHATLPTTGKHAHLPVPIIVGIVGKIAQIETKIVSPRDALAWLSQ